MIQTDADVRTEGATRTRYIAGLLEWAGVGLAVTVAIWACARFWQLGYGVEGAASPTAALHDEGGGASGIASGARGAAASGSATTSFLATLVVLIAGLAGGGLLWAAGDALRTLERLPAELAERTARGPEFTPSVGASAAAVGGLGDKHAETLVLLLREVRDISLLNESQRTRRLETLGQTLAADLEREVPALLREHRWREARRRIQEARARFPTFAQFEALERQVETARAQVETRDIEHAERQVSDLAALEAWDRAADVVRELLERHPDSEQAQQLAARVRNKFERSQAEQRERLMAHAQAAANGRDWPAALQTAQQVIQRYPKSPEAEALRLQMPTLLANSEIQQRQRMEAQIRDLVQQRRFDGALAAAHELIDRYPNSPQAEALRVQLPKLQRMATGLGAGF